jgi:hypothetical protein
MAGILELQRTKMARLPKNINSNIQTLPMDGIEQNVAHGPLMTGPMGQISIGPVSFAGAVKVRVSTSFLPSFTIDLNQPSTGPSILSLIKPKIELLMGGNAYQIDPYSGGPTFSNIDPSIFDTPTFLDKISNMGLISIAGMIILIGFFGYRGIKWVTSKKEEE